MRARKQKRKEVKRVVKLFVIEPLREATPFGKMGRAIQGPTFYGYQQRRRKEAKKLSKSLQKAYQALDKVEENYHRAMLFGGAMIVIPVALVWDLIDPQKEDEA